MKNIREQLSDIIAHHTSRKYPPKDKQEFFAMMNDLEILFIGTRQDGPSRNRLPKKRYGMTYESVVGGLKIYLRTGVYPDGRLGEVFLDAHKEGATLRSLLNCVAILLSIGLQYGVPLSAYCHTLIGQKFEPAGPTNDPEIPDAKSMIDYIFRRLEKDYYGSKGTIAPPTKTDQRQGGEKKS